MTNILLMGYRAQKITGNTLLEPVMKKGADMLTVSAANVEGTPAISDFF